MDNNKWCVKVFGIIPKYRILRLTSKSCIRQIIMVSLIYCHFIYIAILQLEFEIVQIFYRLMKVLGITLLKKTSQEIP